MFSRIRNVSDSVVDKIKPHILCSISFFFDTRAFCGIMKVRHVEPDRPQMTIWHMRTACWIPKATNSKSKYVILIALHGNNCCRIAPQCYVIRILPVSLYLPFI
jgi:hypothetical protein